MAAQDVRVELYYDGQWNDIVDSDDVYTRDAITFGRGRRDEATRLSPAEAGFTADNRDGTYNPRNPASALYGLVGRNTPTRILYPSEIYDTFTRSTSNGWGTSTSGDAWTHEPTGDAADFGVDGTTGWHDAQFEAATRRTLMDGPADGDATFTVSIPEVSSGEAAQSSFLVREDGANANFLCFRVVFLTTGILDPRISIRQSSVETTLANGDAVLPYEADTVVHMRCIWHGPFLALKLWTDDDPEPEEWACVAHDDTFLDAGRIGFRSSVGTDWASWAGTVPLRFTYDDFELTRFRYHGEASSWVPGRAIKGDAWTAVTAAGPLRRLTQGVDPLRTALRRYIDRQTPVAYWSFEEGKASQFVSLTAGNGSPWTRYQFSGPGTFEPGAGEMAPWSGRGAAWRGDVTIEATVGMADSPGTITLDLLLKGDNFTNGTFSIAMDGPAGDGSDSWTIDMYSSLEEIDIFEPGAGSNAAVYAGLFDGSQQRHIRFTADQDGADIDYTLYINGVQIVTDTVAATTLAPVVHMLMTPGDDGSSVADVALWAGDPPALADFYDAATGHPGETAGRRFERLCSEEDIPARVVGNPDNTQPMGPQYPETLPNLLQEIEATDDGIIYDSRHEVGLELRTGRSFYNQAATLAIDHDAYELAPVTDPVLDDQATRNDVTASRREGSTARAVRESGPLNVSAPHLDPEGVGRYTHQVDVNPVSDLVLGDHAGWHLHRGTVDETRWPAVTVDLVATSGIETEASTVDIGDRITVDNLPADLSPDLVSLVVIGIVEAIGSHTRRITYTCVPESQFHVAELDRTDYNIVGSDSATTNEALDTTETGVDIVCGSGGPWVHEVDYDIVIGGERMTVTAVGASAGTFPNQTQTLTVTRSVNGVVKSHASGASVAMFDKIYIGL